MELNFLQKNAKYDFLSSSNLDLLFMKKIIGLFILFNFTIQFAHAQGGVWTWMKGANIPNVNGTYGLQGISNNGNNPPARYQASYWTDLDGNFWLFGGTMKVGSSFDFLNDLWVYNIGTNQWTWVNGPQYQNDKNGNYGPLGVPGTNFYPSARGNGSISWTDNNGNLWLYGGAGIDASNNQGALSDLWKFDVITKEWTWVKGSNNIGATPNYGVLGVATASNSPGARLGGKNAWVDLNNDLWLFGGNTTTSGALFYNDLWKFNITSNMWTWVNGNNAPNPGFNYGALGVESPTNQPPPRWSASRWKGVDNKFYLFGGHSVFNPSANILNDLWQYNPLTNNWTWISGNNNSNQLGNYSGGTCNPDKLKFPSARYENHTAQTIGCSEIFWSFGGRAINGDALNDLWLYNLTNSEWTWVSGSQASNQAGNFGVQGVANSANMIPSRYGVCIWVDDNNNLWVFGGQNNGQYHNDLWKFSPDTTCFSAPLVASFTLFPPADSIICIGDTTKMFIPQTANVNWTPSNGVYPNSDTSILSFSPLSNTTYTVLGLDTGKCPGADTIVFNLQVISSNSALLIPPSDTIICQGESTFMNLDPNLTINYFPTNGAFPNSDTSQIIFSPQTTTTYTVIGDYTSCSIPDTVIFTIQVSPLDPINLLAPTQLNLCVGDTTLMNLNPNYIISFTPAIGAYPNADTSQIIFSPPTTTNYLVKATSTGPCPHTDSIFFTINALPTTKTNLPPLHDTDLCSGVPILFDAGKSLMQVTLNTWNGVTVSPDSSQFQFFPSSTTTYTLIASDAFCAIPDTAIFTIQILASPVASFFVNPTETILKYATFTLTNQSINANTYLWYQDGVAFSAYTNESKKVNKLGETCFSLVASNNVGCKDTFSQCIIVNPDPSYLIIPNAFSPNGDGKNDYFNLLSSGNIVIKEFAVYDRWGNEVFRDNTGYWGWDGKYKTEYMEIGTYFYYVRYSENGIEKIKKGDVSLVR